MFIRVAHKIHSYPIIVSRIIVLLNNKYWIQYISYFRFESLDSIVLSCQSCLEIFFPYSLNCGQPQELATAISEVPHSWQLLCSYCNVRTMLVGSDMHCICFLLHILLLPFSVGE